MKTKILIQFCTFITTLVVSGVAGSVLIRDFQTQTRGVSTAPIAPLASPFGVNASLEQYASDADLDRALEMIRGAGFYWVRQFFYWGDIEPRAGKYQWEKWDRIVARADASGLRLVAVITTTPEWARHAGERDLLYARPDRAEDFARFVRAFAARYGGKIEYLQVWDNPNVHPFWGRRNADPFEYAALLRAGALAARAANPNVKILSAGLAPSGELIRARADFSDILYLRGMYDAGARPYFDILGAKPYGMWSGADDRRAAMDTFNFSRAILWREELVAHSDASKPVWAVEFGWNALPVLSGAKDWRGAASPWGTDSTEKQSARLAQGIQRARSEWGWMPALFVQHFQPNAPEDDPVWGFALVDKDFQPRAAYSAAKNALAAPVAPASTDAPQFYFLLGALALLGAFSAFRAWRAFDQLAWRDRWRAAHARFVALPTITQYAILVTAALAFYYSPNALLNFALLGLLVLLFSFRLDLALALTVFSIPFYLLPKNLIGGAMFSTVELFTLACAAAWVIQTSAKSPPEIASAQSFDSASQRLRSALHAVRFTSADWSVVALVLIAALSVKSADNFGVANREFRVNIVEPALLYALIRASNLQRRDLRRLMDAFILSAVAISLIAIYQLLFTNYVIIGEGVRRVLAVYGSPNNLALYLDRALPLVVALMLFGGREQPHPSPPNPLPPLPMNFIGRGGRGRRGWGMRQLLYPLAALTIAAALYFTFSRGAWLLGLPAGIIALGWLGGTRARLAVIALGVIGAVLLIPFLQTERAQSLFQSGTGTGFFRVSVWQSAIAMIRDHPFLGVGLDNFLYEYPKYMNPEAWREPNLSHPHNIVLDFWARLGVLGVVVLGWIVVEFCRRGLRELRELGTERAVVVGLMASITAALAHGLIDAAFFYVDLGFVWMLCLGLMVEWSDSQIAR